MVRWLFTLGCALIVAAVVLSAVVYRAELNYRFEVTARSIAWLVLIASGTLLTVMFTWFHPGRGTHPVTDQSGIPA